MKQAINILKKAVQTKRLVIFVGSGVSKNSNVPTWGNIVRLFAKKLDYMTCSGCSKKTEQCHRQCQSTYQFCTDEYIKIPQYYYCVYGKDDYLETIKEVFNQSYDTNILGDLIAQIQPDHIVTTNYDHLLDHYGYEVIQSDGDLLKAKSNHFLIKMHGDLDDLESLVLKEDDYLQYSETHPLIELFIKSLLIDHIFLFVGYSLNDYNLKNFLGWIDFLARNHRVRHQMHSHFLMTVDIAEGQAYLFDYYAQKNIQVMDLKQLPKELLEKSKSVPLSDEIGQKVYAVLETLKP